MRRSVYGLGKAQQFWTCFVIRALLVHGLSSVESGLEEGRVTSADPMTVLRRILLHGLFSQLFLFFPATGNAPNKHLSFLQSATSVY